MIALVQTSAEASKKLIRSDFSGEANRGIISSRASRN